MVAEPISEAEHHDKAGIVHKGWLPHGRHRAYGEVGRD